VTSDVGVEEGKEGSLIPGKKQCVSIKKKKGGKNRRKGGKNTVACARMQLLRRGVLNTNIFEEKTSALIRREVKCIAEGVFEIGPMFCEGKTRLF